MKLQVRTYPDPVLSMKCVPVKEITPELKELAENMLETMYANEGIGLAAPQIGEPLRLVVIDLTAQKDDPNPIMLVNPEIVSREGEVSSEEGCLSVESYRARVKRAEKVVVRAQDIEGNDIEIEADDIFAICLQHEIDHLDGVLFIDKISRLKRSMYDKKVRKWAKKLLQETEL